jgi:hypothetical protein
MKEFNTIFFPQGRGITVPTTTERFEHHVNLLRDRPGMLEIVE